MSSPVLDEPPPQAWAWHRGLDFDELERVLGEGEVVALLDGPRGGGRTLQGDTASAGRVGIVELEGGVRGVFKHRSGAPHAALAESAAYRLARRVGFRSVPPTVCRALAGRAGSLQLFVDGVADQATMSSETRAAMHAAVPERERSDRVVFLFVFGQWDNTLANCLLVPTPPDQAGDSPSQVVVDNEGIASLVEGGWGSYPFRAFLPLASGTVDASLRFPQERVRTLVEVTPEDLRRALGPLVASPKGLEGLAAKLHAGAEDLEYVTWHGALWVRRSSYLARRFFTPTFSRETIARYATLTRQELRDLLPASAFWDVHLRRILTRRDEVVEAALAAQCWIPSSGSDVETYST